MDGQGWLTLTRKPGQKIFIGDDVEVCVSQVNGDAVKVSVRAPRNVLIWRGELKRAIDARRAAA